MFIASKDKEKFCDELKTIYTAPSEEAGLDALKMMQEHWPMYQAYLKSWETRWADLAPFFSYPQAVLGDKVSVATIDGPVSMKIPAGTQPGEVFRIRGKGVPHLGRYGHGDHLVTVKLIVPKKLSHAEKELIEQLKKNAR